VHLTACGSAGERGKKIAIADAQETARLKLKIA
jgi:hypothetical protein